MQPIIEQIGQRYPNIDLPVFILPHGQLKQLTGFELTRGALGAFRRPIAASVEEVCRNARRVAVLEDITNHTNVGAIFRSAAALGIDAVLVTQACYDPLYRRAVRVSMGTVFQVPWARIGADSGATGAGSWATTAFRCCTALDLKLPLWRCRTFGFHRRSPTRQRRAPGPGLRNRRRRLGFQHHRELRLHRAHSYGARGRQPQRGSSKRRCLLGTESKVANRCFSDP